MASVEPGRPGSPVSVPLILFAAFLFWTVVIAGACYVLGRLL